MARNAIGATTNNRHQTKPHLTKSDSEESLLLLSIEEVLFQQIDTSINEVG